MKILNVKGADRISVLSKIEEVYGNQYTIIKESEKIVGGFLGLFAKTEFSAKIMIKEQGETTEQQFLFAPKEEETIDLRKQVLFNQREIKPSPQKNESNENALDLFQKLKQQLDGIQEYIKDGGTPSNSIRDTLVSFMKKEMIDDLVIDDILKRLPKEPSVSEIMSGIEQFIRSCSQEDGLKPKDEKLKVFVGTTGVGKTTTIAKITADLLLNKHKKIALFTSDTYRIAAVDQLNTYADIFKIPVEVIYPEGDINEKIEKYKDVDYILIDTAGRSHKNKEQVQEIEMLLAQIKNKTTYLVLNVNTPFVDIKNIIDVYKKVDPNLEVVVTKTDETELIGNILNILFYIKKPIRYVTFGQEVPNDFELFKTNNYIETFLERIEV